MHRTRNSILTLAGALATALALAACGGSDNSDNGSAGGTADTGSAQTVATQSVPGVGNVLVDSGGMVLYTNDMDTRSKIACTDSCLTEWVPLAAPSGGQPTSDDSAVQAKLGTTQRSDGSSQVTLGGLPLYSFVEDTPGQSTGDGFRDSFDGTEFLWTAATVSGKSTPPATTTTESSGGSSGGYGGGY